MFLIMLMILFVGCVCCDDVVGVCVCFGGEVLKSFVKKLFGEDVVKVVVVVNVWWDVWR